MNSIDFSWVVPGKLGGSGYPFNQEHIDYLKQQGICLLICLSSYMNDAYQQNASLSNIEIAHIPIQDFAAPSIEQAEIFVAVVNKAFTDSKPVCVHCFHGKGRTGTMLAYYFMKTDNLNADDAIKKIRMLRPGSIETKVQEKFLHSCSK